MTDLGALKPWVGRFVIADEFGQRTAFLAAPGIVLTCKHCLYIDDGSGGLQPLRQVTIEFPFLPGGGESQVVDVPDDVREHKGLDLALILLKSPIRYQGSPPRLANRALKDDRFIAYGFPNLSRDGIDLAGHVREARYLREGIESVALKSDEARDMVTGVSGAAVLSRNAVIAIQSNQLLKRDGYGGTEPAFRRLYAVPLGEAQDWLQQHAPQLEWIDRRPMGPLEAGFDEVSSDVASFFAAYLGPGVPFGGRMAEFARLNTWLQTADRPFAVLAAPIGAGKSALLARWANALNSSGDARMAFVPISSRFQTSGEIAVGQMLVARLRFLSGKGGTLPADMEALRREIRELLSSSQWSAGKPLVVVLDGLDEAPWHVSRLNLPDRPGSNVRILAALRWHGDIAGAVKDVRWRDAAVLGIGALEALDCNDIRDAGSSIGITLDEPMATQLLRLITPLRESRPSVASSSMNVAPDPMLMRLYLAEIAERRQAGGDFSAADLSRRPAGWDGYVERWWDDQTAHWDTHVPLLVLTTLGLLCGARHPVSLEDVHGAAYFIDAHVRRDDVHRVLTVELKRFLGRQDSRPPHRYFFGHPLLRTFFERYLPARHGLDLAEHERALAQHFRDCLERLAGGSASADDMPLYGVIDTGRHLGRMAREPLSERGLASSDWYQAKRAAGAGEWAMLTDVQALRARTAESWKERGHRPFQYEETDRRLLALLVKCALFESSIEARLAHWPHALYGALVARNRLSATEAASLALRYANGPSGASSKALARIARELSDEELDHLVGGGAPADAASRALAEAGHREDEPLPEGVERIPLLVEWVRRGTREETRHRLAATLSEARQLHTYNRCWAIGLMAPMLAAELGGIALIQRALTRLHDDVHHGKRLQLSVPLVHSLPESLRLKWLSNDSTADPNSVDHWGLAPLLVLMSMNVPDQAVGERLLASLDGVVVHDQDASLRQKRMAQFAETLAECGLLAEARERTEHIDADLHRKAMAELAPHLPADWNPEELLAPSHTEQRIQRAIRTLKEGSYRFTPDEAEKRLLAGFEPSFDAKGDAARYVETARQVPAAVRRSWWRSQQARVQRSGDAHAQIVLASWVPAFVDALDESNAVNTWRWLWAMRPRHTEFHSPCDDALVSILRAMLALAPRVGRDGERFVAAMRDRLATVESSLLLTDELEVNVCGVDAVAAMPLEEACSRLIVCAAWLGGPERALALERVAQWKRETTSRREERAAISANHTIGSRRYNTYLPQAPEIGVAMREAAHLPREHRAGFLSACLDAFDPAGWDSVGSDRVALLGALPRAACARIWHCILAVHAKGGRDELLELLEASGPVFELVFGEEQRTELRATLNTVTGLWP